MTIALRPNDHVQQRVVLSFDHQGPSSYPTSGVKATGTIQCLAVASMADSDYMTIGDGLNPAVLYEFDVTGNGVTAGRVQVNISAATTAADVAALLRTAILANQPELAVVNAGSGLLNLTANQPGAFANVTITENVANAGFLVTGMSGGLDSDPNSVADATVKLMKMPWRFRVDAVQYVNPTGLAEHADNHFAIKLLKGSTVVASYSTDADQAGDNGIAADTFINLTLSATDADLVFAQNDEMKLFLDEGGTASLPPGRVVVIGRTV